jgi:glycosyltransferase involved in cell wall biosynthesis
VRVGFFAVLDAFTGGVHQYSLAMLEALASRRGSDEFVVFADPSPLSSNLREQGWDVRPVSPTTLVGRGRAIVGRVLGPEKVAVVSRRLYRIRDARAPNDKDVGAIYERLGLGQWFQRCGIDLMVYPAMHPFSFESGMPYIAAVHDLQHRLQPHFPEVSADGEWEHREYVFRHGIERATLVIADSEVGREDIVSLYDAPESRIKVLPFPPPALRAATNAEVVRVALRYDLPSRYGFYPAQFWPHKNHARIVRAVAVARERGVDISLAFAGAHTGGIREGCYAEVRRLVAELGLESQIQFLGYVPDEDVPPLYAGAHALVMPTFFGPTNIPVLEAWQFGCAVLSSDIRGIRDQVGDAGVLVDPEAVEDLADGLVRLWTDDSLHGELVARGAKRVAAYTFDDFADRLRAILDEAADRLGDHLSSDTGNS